MAFSTAINTSLLTTYLLRKFIPALEDELQFQKFTTKGTIPEGMGNIARFNVFSSPAANTTALTEGTTTGNEITTLTTTGVDATVAEYGEFLAVNRMAEFMSVPGSRQQLSDRMGYGAARSLDAIVRTNPGSGTGAQDTTVDWYCGAGANGGSGTAATPTAGSAAALIGAAALIRGVSGRGFRGIKGHTDGHLAAILTPTFERDMVQESSTGRMTWAEANTDVPGSKAQEKWVDGYMGSVYGTACYRTQAFFLTTVTSSSENNFLLAEGGLGAVSIIDADPQVFVNVASANDVGNPYRNRNTIAWHAYFAAALIDSNRVVRIYSLA